jgi:hypothetical protein
METDSGVDQTGEPIDLEGGSEMQPKEVYSHFEVEPSESQKRFALMNKGRRATKPGVAVSGRCCGLWKRDKGT